MVTNSSRRRFSGHAFWLAIWGAVAVSACSGGGGGAGSGGSTASGGAPGSGGATSSGGSTGTGGVVILTGSGGSTASGGSTGTGGSAATGGATGTGGSTGSGGSTANGGSTGTGGAAGSVASGGATGTGGAGGKGGSAGTSGGAGGATGSGGAGGRAGAGGGTGGAGGATNCAGHAISLSANVAANNDPAKAAVLVAFNGSADLPTGNANRTIEFWAYVPSSAWVADANTMFFYGTNNRVADGFGLDFGTTSNGMGTIDPFTNNLFDNDNQPSGLSATSSQWAHFAMTWDGTTVRAYVNGVLKASKVSTSSTQKTLMTGVTALTIGGYPPAYFNGEIDEFRIWNVARSASDLMSTMNHTLVGDETGLTGYWKFDETSGTTAADSVTSAGHTPHPGMLSASSTANNPTWVVSTAPLSCP